MTQRLQDMVCVVTGAARGIGRAIAERCAADGARIACLDVGDARLQAAIDEMCTTGIEARGYATDVGCRDAVQAAFERIEQDFGAPIGVLVNNAVWARFQPLADIDVKTLDHMLAVGLQGLIWTLQAAAPQMQRRGSGSVVNVCSTNALRGMPNSIAYAAMKAGVLGLTRSAAIELSPQRIRVNAVVPGMVATHAVKANFSEATLAARVGAIPMSRFAEPSEIASVVAFLASEESSYIQGAEIVIDGGWSVSAI